MSKLCLAACRVVVEVVVAKLDNWRRAVSGKAVFKLNRKNGFGQLQNCCWTVAICLVWLKMTFLARQLSEHMKKPGNWCILNVN